MANRDKNPGREGYSYGIQKVALTDASGNVILTDSFDFLATSGSNTTLTDNTKDWIVNELKDKTLSVEINGVVYNRKIVSNTANTITISALPTAQETVTIGSGDNGEVTITTVAHGNFGRTITVENGTEEDGSLTAELDEDDNLLVTLGMDSGGKAFVSIGDEPNQIVDIEANTAGSDGNNYRLEVVVSETPNADLSVALQSTKIVITLGTISNGDPDNTKNTATLICDLINNDETVSSIVTATLLGDGSLPFTTGIAEQNFINGGINPQPADVKNTATLVASAIDTLTAFTAVASGTGATVIDEETGIFTGGIDTVVIASGDKYKIIESVDIKDVVNNSSIDRGTGTADFAVTKAVHCNKDGFYNVKFENNSTASTMFLVAGQSYTGYRIINILTSADGALTAGDITLLY